MTGSKTSVDEGGPRQVPSSHAARLVNARIQAGPLWQEIVHSDELPPPPVETSGWQRLLAWRRSVPTSRLIGVGALAAAAITAISLASSPYRWPTLPDPVGGGIIQIVHPPADDSEPTDAPSVSPSATSSVPSQIVEKKAPASPTHSAQRTEVPSPSIVAAGGNASPTPSSPSTGATTTATATDTTTTTTTTTDTTVATTTATTPDPATTTATDNP